MVAHCPPAGNKVYKSPELRHHSTTKTMSTDCDDKGFLKTLGPEMNNSQPATTVYAVDKRRPVYQPMYCLF
jgi:hypothetical protein